MKTKVVVLGHVCIDHNLSESTSYTSPGGPATFISKIYKKFPGIDLKVITPYGVDFQQYETSISLYPIQPTSDWTLLYENKSEGNVRTQRALNTDEALPVAIDEDFKSVLIEADIFIFAPLTSYYLVEYVQRVVRFLKKDCLKVLLPQGYFRNFTTDGNVVGRNFVEAGELVPLFDCVIVSDQDFPTISNLVQQWSQQTSVITTLGDKGARYCYKNELIEVPAESVSIFEIVDSVGSGDIFSAAFTYKFFREKNIAKALGFANNIARQCLFYPADNLQFNVPE